MEGEEVKGRDVGVEVKVEDAAGQGNEDDDDEEIKLEVVLNFENDEEPVVANEQPMSYLDVVKRNWGAVGQRGDKK